MVTTHGLATLAELEAVMGIDFSANPATSPIISDTTIEARGSDIEEFLIGLTHVTYTSSTIPADVKAYFKKAWQMDIEQFAWSRGIRIFELPKGQWEDFLKSKFNIDEIIEQEQNDNNISDFISASDF